VLAAGAECLRARDLRPCQGGPATKRVEMSLRDGEGAEFVALLQQRMHGRLRGPESDP